MAAGSLDHSDAFLPLLLLLLLLLLLDSLDLLMCVVCLAKRSAPPLIVVRDRGGVEALDLGVLAGERMNRTTDNYPLHRSFEKIDSQIDRRTSRLADSGPDRLQPFDRSAVEVDMNACNGCKVRLCSQGPEHSGANWVGNYRTSYTKAASVSPLAKRRRREA
ncbi:hypothetical protein F5884DRAFT_158646 [Xylogone sp. PMI_703]|nr:hypothetical protein F5884DRAFT_158646 [Xylogone sp. PMI_703]